MLLVLGVAARPHYLGEGAFPPALPADNRYQTWVHLKDAIEPRLVQGRLLHLPDRNPSRMPHRALAHPLQEWRSLSEEYPVLGLDHHLAQAGERRIGPHPTLRCSTVRRSTMAVGASHDRDLPPDLREHDLPVSHSILFAPDLEEIYVVPGEILLECLLEPRIAHIGREVFGRDLKKLTADGPQQASQQRSAEAPDG